MLALMAGSRRMVATVASALALAAVPGCGDGAEDVTAEELASRADEICRQGQERFAEVQSDPPANAAEATELTDQLIEVSEDVLNELRDLRPPEDLETAYTGYLEVRGRALEFFRRGRDAAAAQDAKAYAAAQQEVAASAAKRRRLAEAVGFEDCSHP